MKLSTKSRYGLKACYELALRKDEGAISLSSLVESTGTTINYLEQIMLLLRKNNIVNAERGAQGGYFLSREPKDISVGEILRALEDGLRIVECVASDCYDMHLCPTHNVWQKMYDALNNMLDKYSLQDMIQNMEDK